MYIIAQEKLQSPLQILNCLSVNNGPNLLSVREYFIQVFNKEIDIINNDEILVNKYKNDTNILREHINFLTNGPIEFRSTLCDTCHQPLSLPSLYFHCQHAYHQELVTVLFLFSLFYILSILSFFLIILVVYVVIPRMIKIVQYVV